MSYRNWIGVLILAAGLLCTARPVQAQTIIGNLPGTDGGSTSVSSSFHNAAGFTMGSTAYTLTSAKLRMIQLSGSVPILELRANNGGIPGAVLTTFTNPSFVTGIAGEYTFLPGSAVTLQANTRYWLYGRGENTNTWHWRSVNPGTTPTGPGATSAGYLFSFNAGGGFVAQSNQAFYSIQGTPVTAGDAPAVPEPGAVVLFLPALGMVLGVMRRRTP